MQSINLSAAVISSLESLIVELENLLGVDSIQETAIAADESNYRSLEAAINNYENQSAWRRLWSSIQVKTAYRINCIRYLPEYLEFLNSQSPEKQISMLKTKLNQYEALWPWQKWWQGDLLTEKRHQELTKHYIVKLLQLLNKQSTPIKATTAAHTEKPLEDSLTPTSVKTTESPTNISISWSNKYLRKEASSKIKNYLGLNTWWNWIRGNKTAKTEMTPGALSNPESSVRSIFGEIYNLLTGNNNPSEPKATTPAKGALKAETAPKKTKQHKAPTTTTSTALTATPPETGAIEAATTRTVYLSPLAIAQARALKEGIEKLAEAEAKMAEYKKKVTEEDAEYKKKMAKYKKKAAGSEDVLKEETLPKETEQHKAATTTSTALVVILPETSSRGAAPTTILEAITATYGSSHTKTIINEIRKAAIEEYIIKKASTHTTINPLLSDFSLFIRLLGMDPTDPSFLIVSDAEIKKNWAELSKLLHTDKSAINKATRDAYVLDEASHKALSEDFFTLTKEELVGSCRTYIEKLKGKKDEGLTDWNDFFKQCNRIISDISELNRKYDESCAKREADLAKINDERFKIMENIVLKLKKILVLINAKPGGPTLKQAALLSDGFGKLEEISALMMAEPRDTTAIMGCMDKLEEILVLIKDENPGDPTPRDDGKLTIPFGDAAGITTTISASEASSAAETAELTVSS